MTRRLASLSVVSVGPPPPFHHFCRRRSGNAAFHIDRQFEFGDSGRCQTFGSPSLCGEDSSGRFRVFQIEVWSPTGFLDV